MNISEVIEELESIKEQEGNLPIEWTHEFGFTEEVEIEIFNCSLVKNGFNNEKTLLISPLWRNNDEHGFNGCI